MSSRFATSTHICRRISLFLLMLVAFRLMVSAQVPVGDETSDGTAPIPASAARPTIKPAETLAPVAPPPQDVCVGKRMIFAEVYAFARPMIMLNRLGANIPDGLIFALRQDVVESGGNATLKPNKRPRPIVLRANQDDCVTITFTNKINTYPNNVTDPNSPPNPATPVPTTPKTSLHVQGMQLVKTINSDGTFAGANDSSLANNVAPGQSRTYVFYAQDEGTFLLSSDGDSSTTGQQLLQGMFGAMNVQPKGAEWYRSQVTADDLKKATYNAGSLPAGMTITPAGCATGPLPKQCTLQTVKSGTTVNTPVIVMAGGYLHTKDGQPLVNYVARYPTGDPRAGQPVLNMLDGTMHIVHSDLTAIITGPNAGRFPGATGNPNTPDPPCNAENDPALRPPPGVTVNPLFCQNPAAPDRKQPYREITTMYHEVDGAVQQAFPKLYDGTQNGTDGKPIPVNTMKPGFDGFSINYGTGGIGSEIFANRIGVGPMKGCVDCKYEEFFLSAWAVGDPAMVVDNPGNSGATATKAFYPDDPSNVYHSYMNDHVKFRILHGGTGVPHVHHQHAHQWLQSPNSDEGSYLDSQMISPGASYTLEMVYNGSGNRNKTVGDSIFHCHFYPHFAAGMWAMWRVHDVMEEGTQLDANGVPTADSRALPDGEILAGTPVPALVPLPTLPMAPMPAYAKIEKGTAINGVNITTGGQIAIGGTCQSNKVDNIPLASGTCANGQHVDGKVINGQFVVTPIMENPGYPYFIPGIAGLRAPHPPLDFAVSNGHALDGGLPRHLIYGDGGTPPTQSETQFDWSKDLVAAQAVQLDERGQPAEVTAMKFFGVRCHTTFLPDGSPADCHTVGGQPFGFIVNGLPRGPQSGAPFADPAVNDDGTPVPGNPRRYKAAAIQLDVTFNKKGWHFPQQRMLTLWGDVQDTFTGKRPPEPFFFRANSGEYVEYWHTNLVPNYYLVDDYQVRTPTDILGQHIHLVKFDVTSSDGAGNGWNYEDGTFSPDEVREIINAINNTAKGGSWKPLPSGPTTLAPAPPPAELGPAPAGQNWLGAQTTIQRWFVDPLRDDLGTDRTMRTVFTHDHFGPSTHQQAGLYAGLVIEPSNSTWKNSETGTAMGNRVDGGPTSWKADIWTTDLNQSYREFLLEFQDFQLAYSTECTPQGPYPNPDPSKGYRQGFMTCQGAGGSIPNRNAIQPPSTPQLISTGPSPGTMSVNYRNDPVPFRLGQFGDPSYAFASAYTQPGATQPNGDPDTPMLRAYQNDNVQVRILVGAHMGPHFFNIHGNKWLFEPAWSNSGYRNTQAMGLSEHFELLFTLPSTSTASSTRKCPDGYGSDGDCADYLYSPSLDDTGLANGMWGLMRAYDPTKPFSKLQQLPNNKSVTPLAANTNVTCPPGAPVRTFDVKAVTSEQTLPNGLLVFNSRGAGTGDPNSMIRTKDGIFYAFTSDIDSNNKLKPGVPIEPLIMRAAAGECIQVTVRNRIPQNSDVLTQTFSYQPPFAGTIGGTGVSFPIHMSKKVGLHPQLLALDVTNSNGFNVGYNPYQVADIDDGSGKTYTWYAGDVKRITPANPCPPTSTQANGLCYTPIEFGSLNLMPSDPLTQHINGLYGGMIIEPAGSQWKCDGGVACDSGQLSSGPPVTGTPPITRASANVFRADNSFLFREFALMFHDDMLLSQNNTSAVNYRTEPTFFRYGNPRADSPTFAANGDNFCAESNQLVDADPQTPVFAASLDSPVRIRLLHPPNAGNNQVFTLSGHVWQRNPYTNKSTVIGDNPLSQWMGSRDGYGSTDHADLVLARAGGQSAVTGDYRYTSFLPSMTQFGLWGVMRVVPANSDGVVITSVSATSSITVQGTNTVVPKTGLYASTVTIFKGATPTGTPLGTATVNQLTGAWTFNCSGGSCPGAPVTLTAKSQGGGVTTFNPATQQAGCQAVPSSKPYTTDLQDRFLRHPANTKVQP